MHKVNSNCVFPDVSKNLTIQQLKEKYKINNAFNLIYQNWNFPMKLNLFTE